MKRFAVAKANYLEGSLDLRFTAASDWRSALQTAYNLTAKEMDSLPEDYEEARTAAVNQDWDFVCMEVPA